MFISKIKFCVVLLALFCLTPSVGFGQGQECISTGDLDGNGSLDVDDFIILLNLAANFPALAEPWQADVNGDCIVDSADVLAIHDRLISCRTGDCDFNTVTCCEPELMLIESCCQGTVGNVNADPLDITDIADLTFLIDHLFINFPPLDCPAEGNIDADPEGKVDIADLTFLIGHMFINVGAPLPGCHRWQN